MDCSAGEHRKISWESSFLICLRKHDARNHRHSFPWNTNSTSARGGDPHSRYVIFQMAEVAVPRELSAATLERIRRFGVSPRCVQRVSIAIERNIDDSSEALVDAARKCAGIVVSEA